MDPVAPLGCLYLSIQIESMFIYGGDSWIRANDLLRMKELHYRCAMSPFIWQGIQESNLCQRSQSPLCYHYTNPQHKKYECKLLKNILLTLYRLNTCSITQSGRLSTTIFIDVVFIQHKEKPPRVCYLSRGLVFVFSFGLFWSSGITSPHLRCVAVGFLKARNILPRTWHIISCC